MNLSNFLSSVSVALASLLLWSCSDEPSVQKYQVLKTPVAVELPSASNPGTVPNTGLPLTWVVPAGWEEGTTSSMRLASFNVPLSDGGVGDFSLVQLGGGAGGIMANINRWRGQIGLGDAAPEEIGKNAHMHTTGQGMEYLHITLINDDNSGSAIIAGIFERPGFTLFAKLSATKAGVLEAQNSFEAFCNSIVFNDV
ncbi:MAG: hypothetical protein O3C43_07665 [Verrucomicrobia bacterium]|nr:hypothetical protein [Verrucomicrobiota bacterium]MDA1066364.1 hypothetical protein [Verrucomicrobiota bacterium]